MTENSNVISIEAPVNPLEELLKTGAQQLLAQAIEAELAALLAQYQNETVEGLQRIVKNGYQPSVRSTQAWVAWQPDNDFNDGL